jgi:hypothetical protein
MGGEYMPADATRACAIDLHRKGIVGIEYADTEQATGVTARRRSRKTTCHDSLRPPCPRSYGPGSRGGRGWEA